ncbi:tyrosine-type recombinase/integrase [Pontibacillus salipaludis]|uniref:tyrosine-type recombinase/integrase n=1 Tax=Pontibacillus salipaludis TaxID=1697394 RepID=UPI0031E5D3AF
MDKKELTSRFVKEGLRGKSASTHKTYTHSLYKFSDWLNGAGTDLNEYSRSDVQQYIDYMVAKGKSASTINKDWNSIKRFSSWMNKQDTIEDIDVVKQQDYKQTAPKSLERKELLKLFRDVDRDGNKRDIAIIQVLANTGLRVSELVSLNRRDVTISERKGNLVVRSGKGNKERSIPLNAEVRRAIMKYLEERLDQNEALFISTRVKRISVRSVQHLVSKYGYNAHSLRHTFITGLKRENVDDAIIMSLSGHSSLDMIGRYSAPTEEDKRSVIEFLFK